MLISIGGITEQRCLNLNRFDLVITVLYGKGRSESQTQDSVDAVLHEAWPFPIVTRAANMWRASVCLNRSAKEVINRGHNV